MSFNEPIPDNYREKTWPVWTACAVTVATVSPLLIITQQPLWLLLYAAYFAFLAFWMLRAHRRHKRWNREMDAWSERMFAHYARPFEQRRKAMWS